MTNIDNTTNCAAYTLKGLPCPNKGVYPVIQDGDTFMVCGIHRNMVEQGKRIGIQSAPETFTTVEQPFVLPVLSPTTNEEEVMTSNDPTPTSRTNGTNPGPHTKKTLEASVDYSGSVTVMFRLTPNHAWEEEMVFSDVTLATNYISNVTHGSVGEFAIKANGEILTNNKEDIMDVTEYIFTSKDDRNIVVMTNNPAAPVIKAIEVFEEAYQEGKVGLARSRQRNAGLPIVEPIKGSINWRFSLMMNRVADKGGTFTIQVLEGYDEDDINLRIDRASFAFPDPGDKPRMTIITIFDADGNKVAWEDFESYMGLEFRNTNKFPKRAKEITRKIMLADYSETYEPVIHTIEVDSELEIAVDGLNAMSMSMALRMANSIPDPIVRKRWVRDIRNRRVIRVNYRMLSPHGLMKGDRIIVPDSVLTETYGYAPDLVEPTIDGAMINVKTEIRTTGWFHQTAEPHHGHHSPMTNDQLLACMSKNGTWLFTPDELKEDLTSYIGEAKEQLMDPDAYPDFLKSSVTENNDGTMTVDPDRLAKRISDMTYRWSVSGRHIMESEFLISMAGGQLANRLKKAYYTDSKIRMPIRHAAYVHVAALSVIHMCGFDPAADGFDTTKSFYYEKAHSWVSPDDVYIGNYERHGGYDGDDSLIVTIRNFEMEDGTEKIMGIQTRMPMAWGEYAIVEVDLKDFPFYNTWNEMPTIKMADRPEYLEEMEQVMFGMPEDDTVIPDLVDRDWIKYQAQLAQMNPGVGSIINSMIGYYTTFGHYPPEQLAATEDYVDNTTQSQYEAAFVALNGEIERMTQEIISSGLPIDSHIWKERIFFEGKGDADIEVVSNTFYAEMIGFCRISFNSYASWLNRNTRNIRLPIQELMDIKLPVNTEIRMRDGMVLTNVNDWAKRFIKHFKNLNSKYPTGADSETRRRYSGDLNRRCVAGMLRQPNWHLLMVAIYQEIINTNDKDKILFQTPFGPDEMGMMDLFLEVLFSLGLVHKFTEDGRRRYMIQVK